MGDDIFFFVDANLTLFQFDYRSKNAEQITPLTQFAKHGSGTSSGLPVIISSGSKRGHLDAQTFLQG